MEKTEHGEEDGARVTKHVDIADGALRLNETELSALRLVAERAPGVGNFGPVSLSEFCAASGVSAMATRRAVHSLESRGLVESAECFEENGGQRANVYALTTMGALAAAAAGRESGGG